MRVLEYTADGSRLDVLLSQDGVLSRSRAAELIKGGAVTVDGRAEGLPSAPGALVRVEVPEPAPRPGRGAGYPAENPLSGCAPGRGGQALRHGGTSGGGQPGWHAGQRLLYHLDQLSGIGGELRPGIVHRLDKDTSGLLLVAKDDETHQALSAQLSARQMEKHYFAVVAGVMKERAGVIDAPIGRSHADRKKMAIDPNGRPSRTEWQVVRQDADRALLDVHLITGRTHQIRVHMASIHHPVLGDPIYGTKGLQRPRG